MNDLESGSSDNATVATKQFQQPRALLTISDQSPGAIEMKTKNLEPFFDNGAFEWGNSTRMNNDGIDEHNMLLNEVRNKQQPTTKQGQPLFHQNNKGFIEKFCKCCAEDNDLTQREINYYYKFQEELIHPYDENDLSHEQFLKYLYMKVFRKLPEEIPDRIISEEWQTIGFQGKNPRTDFRGSGILGLHCIKYFVLEYQEEFEMMRVDKSETFFFAITSINVTHMLIAYFYLNKEEISQDAKRLRTGRKQMKRFARLNLESKRTFYELHSQLLIYLYKLWNVEYEKSKPRPPNFNIIIGQVKMQLHDFLKTARITNLESMKQQFQNLIQVKFSAEDRTLNIKDLESQNQKPPNKTA